MAALFLGRRKDIKKAASGPITEQVSGEQHNCCSVIGNLQNLKKLQNIFYDGIIRTLCASPSIRSLGTGDNRKVTLIKHSLNLP